MAEILGQTFLDSINNNDYKVEEITAASYKKSVADTLQANFDENILNRSQALIGGGIEKGGQTISIENAPYPLPLRYLNPYKKLIHPDQQIELSPYLIFESEMVSRSHMKIIQISDLDHIDQQIQEYYRLDQENTQAAQEEEKKETEDTETASKK
ncbi:hypothetical protein ACKP2L_07300 [Oenococcus alcoholitolerans]|uniref:Uncharacterized protein n=1 Tax=Oenococcus alcoholitolerans TaxID=931074 RepID=A0ABR4XRY4_9LACO|nr:hypothetical protein Q757_02190 [Oenococcus alcoholitolerans]